MTEHDEKAEISDTQLVLKGDYSQFAGAYQALFEEIRKKLGDRLTDGEILAKAVEWLGYEQFGRYMTEDILYENAASEEGLSDMRIKINDPELNPGYLKASFIPIEEITPNGEIETHDIPEL